MMSKTKATQKKTSKTYMKRQTRKDEGKKAKGKSYLSVGGQVTKDSGWVGFFWYWRFLTGLIPTLFSPWCLDHYDDPYHGKVRVFTKTFDAHQIQKVYPVKLGEIIPGSRPKLEYGRILALYWDRGCALISERGVAYCMSKTQTYSTCLHCLNFSVDPLSWLFLSLTIFFIFSLI